MRTNLQTRLLSRELGDTSIRSSIKGIYGDIHWINELDIVQELGGHSGCVNALSWSKSGKLLASGSDDQYLNIHQYQPEDSTKPFLLAATVATGHTANIFSVKFMPHSNDRTLVTCAGDSQVRVFDIEHSSRLKQPCGTSDPLYGDQSAMRRSAAFAGTRYLGEHDTNAKVYRSHGDRVKRIVTESSPHLFLSCSEDGEVRQWDLRLPSSAYPAPSYRHSGPRVPRPLISYKRYSLDLNSISCSASQPHYIALGGRHLHCFLHDRRMLGRDLLAEKGAPGKPYRQSSHLDHEDELTGSATRCVRRFAPQGQSKMRKSGNGHITACKISDANPNEMIVSWSGDHIYSFNLIKSPDAREAEQSQTHLSGSPQRIKSKNSVDLKRKRRQTDSTPSAEGAQRGSSRSRASLQESSSSDLALRLRYDNGQSEDINIDDSPPPYSFHNEATEGNSSTAYRKRIVRIPTRFESIRLRLLHLDPAIMQIEDVEQRVQSARLSFQVVCTDAASLLIEMDAILAKWKYPVTPSQADVTFQMTLRRNRASCRRFLQAAGVLARCLSDAPRSGPHTGMIFSEVGHPPIDEISVDSGHVFTYDLLWSIVAWLDGGKPALMEGIAHRLHLSAANSRVPMTLTPDASAIAELLIPNLLALAEPRPIFNSDASIFLHDNLRMIFQDEAAAVHAFNYAVETSLHGYPGPPPPLGEDVSTSAEIIQAEWKAVQSIWAFGVGRGLLLGISNEMSFNFVREAFMVEEMEVLAHDTAVPSPAHEGMSLPQSQSRPSFTLSPPIDQEGSTTVEEQVDINEETDEDDVDETDELDEEDDHDDGHDGSNSANHDDDGEWSLSEQSDRQIFYYRRASDRRNLLVDADVPCVAYIRRYQGHRNIETVKDVNYFGRNDEYVVSGSDTGHLFIWDAKTSRLINILEGDGEVVNVVQGHPYEPMLAVSGIDHTIKIFSPDQQAQYTARHGINPGTPAGSAGTSSIRMWPRGRRFPGNRTLPGPRQPGGLDSPSVDSTASQSYQMEALSDEEDLGPAKNGGLTSRRRMQDSYQITSQNEAGEEGRVNHGGRGISRAMLAAIMAGLEAHSGPVTLDRLLQLIMDG